MGWFIFFCYLSYGVLINLMMSNQHQSKKELREAIEAGADEEKIKELEKACKSADIMVNIMIWIGIISVAVFVLYGLGWVWFFFCGGFLLFEDQPFWDKVVCGLISLIPLGFFIGFIRICCGWDPDKK